MLVRVRRRRQSVRLYSFDSTWPEGMKLALAPCDPSFDGDYEWNWNRDDDEDDEQDVPVGTDGMTHSAAARGAEKIRSSYDGPYGIVLLTWEDDDTVLPVQDETAEISDIFEITFFYVWRRLTFKSIRFFLGTQRRCHRIARVRDLWTPPIGS